MGKALISYVDHPDFDMVLALRDSPGALDEQSARSICQQLKKHAIKCVVSDDIS
jgi:hypothetical protein